MGENYDSSPHILIRKGVGGVTLLTVSPSMTSPCNSTRAITRAVVLHTGRSALTSTEAKRSILY